MCACILVIEKFQIEKFGNKSINLVHWINLFSSLVRSCAALMIIFHGDFLRWRCCGKDDHCRESYRLLGEIEICIVKYNILSPLGVAPHTHPANLQLEPQTLKGAVLVSCWIQESSCRHKGFPLLFPFAAGKDSCQPPPKILKGK